MNKYDIKLVFTPTCTKCPAVKQYFADKDIAYTAIDATTNEGREFCINNGVSSAPTIIVSENNGETTKFNDLSSFIDWYEGK